MLFDRDIDIAEFEATMIRTCDHVCNELRAGTNLAGTLVCVVSGVRYGSRC